MQLAGVIADDKLTAPAAASLPDVIVNAPRPRAVAMGLEHQPVHGIAACVSNSKLAPLFCIDEH
jgi:hypothetical protein